jgi:hypothetical protein
MRFRITSNAGKASYVVVAYVIALTVLLAVGLTAGMLAATIAWSVLLLIAVAVAVRSFRGEGESKDAPRAWWRMTARPTAGFVFTAVFLLQAIYLAVQANTEVSPGSFYFLAVLNLVIAAFFIYSSIRLRVALVGRSRRRDEAVPVSGEPNSH